MARRRGRRGGSNLGAMGIVVSVVIGLVVLVAIYGFVPTIGYQISSTTTIPATSIWGIPAPGNYTNASQLWISTSGLPVLAVLAIIIGTAIMIFMGI